MNSLLSGLFSRAQVRLHRINRWFQKRAKSGVLEEPLVPVPMLLPALLSPPRRPMATLKVAVISLNSDLLICKSRTLLEEGVRMNLELQLPDFGPLHLQVVVDWVNLSSVSHSLGLRVLHKQNSRQLLHDFCVQLLTQSPR
jgi:hypothetical protein